MKLEQQHYINHFKKVKTMKKFLMTIVAAFAALTMDAQVFVGGSVGVASVKNGNADAETSYKFIPEVGYNLSDEWAIGLQLGYQKGACNLMDGVFAQDVDTEIFQIAPYVRNTFVKSKYVNVFVDLGVGFADIKDNGTMFSIGAAPGVAVNLTESLSFVTHVGFVGFRSFSPDADGVDSSNMVGVDFDNNNITFGLYYNF